MLAARLAPLSSSKSCWNERSRLNACTTAIPDRDSAICAVTAAMRFRTSSWARADLTWNQRVRTSAGGSTTSATSPSRQSLMKSAITAAGSSTAFVTSVGSPCERTSDRASTSLVSRAMIQPARCSEKYRSESEVRWSKRSRRSPSTDQERHQHPAGGLNGEVDADDRCEERLVALGDAAVDRLADEQPAARLRGSFADRGQSKSGDEPPLPLEVPREAGEAGALSSTPQGSRLQTAWRRARPARAALEAFRARRRGRRPGRRRDRRSRLWTVAGRR